MQSIKKRKRNDDDDDDDQDNNVCSAVQCYFARSGASPYCNFHRDKVTCTVCRKRLSHDSFDDHTVERPICKTCIRKTNQRGAGIRTAVHGTFVEKDIAVNAADVSSAFSTAHEQIAQHLNDRLDITPIRIYIRAEVDMERETCEGPLNVPMAFQSRVQTVTAPHQIDDALAEAQSTIIKTIEEFTALGSGWVLTDVNSLTVKTGTYNPIGGSSYIPLSKRIVNTRAVLNIHNFDNKCFLWCVLAKLHPLVGDACKSANRVQKYRQYESELALDGLTWPMDLRRISRFETLNPTLSINVFGLDAHDSVVPLQISSHRNRQHDIDLLLVTKGQRVHYTLVRNLSRLLSSRSVHNGRIHVCRYCLHRFSTQDRLKQHIDLCSTHEAVHIVMPSSQLPKPKSKRGETENSDVQEHEGSASDAIPQLPPNIVRFKDYKSQFRCPFIIYYDFECFINENQQHEPSGFSAITVSDFEHRKPVTYSGPNTMTKFFKHIATERSRICKILKRNRPMLPLTPEEEQRYHTSVMCESCDTAYTLTNGKVHHHCHISGRFIAPLCNRCNLQMKPLKNVTDYFIVLVAHNAKNYDFHCLLRFLPKAYSDYNISIIPTNSEKYISVQIGMLRFLDSYQFLTASLSTLVDNLRRSGVEKFVHCKRHLGQHFDLVTRKQIFPYEFVDSLDKLDHPMLPPRESFYSSLTDENVSEEDYCHAQTVWQSFQMKTLKDYQNLYVKTDILLLADVFEEFRRMSMSYYKLDPANFYTTPGLTYQACLKHSGISLELFTDIDMLLTVEKGIRGGISYIGRRESAANNKHLPETFDPSNPSTYISMLDCNNLYGFSMSEPLPVGDFKWLSAAEIRRLRIKNLGDDDEYGYVFVVDLRYPPHLHDKHNCYPLADEHMLIEEEHLSDVSKNLLAGRRFKPVRKLVPNLCDKKEYVVHYRNLKMYLEEGLVIERIHSAIRFKQSRWLASYISKNTEYRKLSKSTFEKDFFKLLNNSLYGKLMQNLRKQCTVHFVSKMVAAEKQLCKHTCLRWTMINDTFSTVQQRVHSIYWNRCTIIGLTVLQISKLWMYRFHYRHMLPMYMTVKTRDCDGWPIYDSRLQLLFTDTDSFCYHVETDDLYSDLRSVAHLLDTSTYPVDHPLFSRVNEKKVGSFKDETDSVPPLHFIGLRPKLYSLLVTKDVSKSKAKGVALRYTKKHLRHQQYVECLHAGTVVTASFKQIRSRDHQLTTDTVRKVALSSFYDKRWVLPDTQCTLALGHWRIAHSRHSDQPVVSPYDCTLCADLIRRRPR